MCRSNSVEGQASFSNERYLFLDDNDANTVTILTPNHTRTNPSNGTSWNVLN
jgi:hypothetical protein